MQAAVPLNLPPVSSKYEQVRALLLDKVQTHQVRQGDRIPSEPELCRTLKVSRVTVRRALKGLVQEGILQPRQGYGHVVSGTRPRRGIGLLLNRDLFSPPTTPFLPLLLKATRQELHDRDCRVLLYDAAPNDMDGGIDYERLERDIARERFVGLIGVRWPNPPSMSLDITAADQRLLDLLNQKQIPCSVLTDLEMNRSTGTDYHATGYLGVRYFVSRDIRRVGVMVCKPERPESALTAVLNGYQDAMADASIAIEPDWVIRSESNTEESGYEAFKAWWRRPNRPAALVVGDDLLAKGAMIAAIELGVDIPRRLQMAFLTIKGSKTFFPRPFVRLEMDPGEYAKQAVGQLLTMLNDPQTVPPPVRVRPRVVEADQTGMSS